MRGRGQSHGIGLFFAPRGRSYLDCLDLLRLLRAPKFVNWQ